MVALVAERTGNELVMFVVDDTVAVAADPEIVGVALVVPLTWYG